MLGSRHLTFRLSGQRRQIGRGPGRGWGERLGMPRWTRSLHHRSRRYGPRLDLGSPLAATHVVLDVFVWGFALRPVAQHLRQRTPGRIAGQHGIRPNHRSFENSFDSLGKVRIHWLKDGNHDFTPRRNSGRTQEQNWKEAVVAIATFVRQL